MYNWETNFIYFFFEKLTLKSDTLKTHLKQNKVVKEDK